MHFSDKMSATKVGNLLIANDGQSATLTQNGASGTALLVVTLASFFTAKDKPNPRVTKLGEDHVAQVLYDYGAAKSEVRLTVHWDSNSHSQLDFYTFHWKKPANLDALQDHISLSLLSQSDPRHVWYGGANLMDLQWPIEPSFNYARSIFGTNDVHLGDSLELGPEDAFWYGGVYSMDLQWPFPKEAAYNLSEFVLISDIDSLELDLDEDTFWYGGAHSMDLQWPFPKEAYYNLSEFVLGDIYHDSLGLGTDTFWYGGSNLMDLEWPMTKNAYNLSEFMLGDIYQKTQTSGQERYWLCSKKVALTVPWNVPLWTAVVDGQLRLEAKVQGSQFLLQDDHLEYTLTVPKDASNMSLKDFHLQCFKKFLKAPTAYPDLAIVEKPIWSTWANFWTGVNQEGVEGYAKDIKDHDMPISQLELDDMWTTGYGDYEIDSHKFANFSGMVQRLKDEFGVPRLTAWVHPFVNADSKNGQDPELRNKIFVKTKRGDVALSWWWDCPVKLGPDNEDKKEPCAYVLDMTNPDAREWWQLKLEKMQKAGIYTFKFDAGENNWLPEDFSLHSGANPNDFGHDYAFFSAQFGSAVENRYGSGTQQANIFMRTMDRNSYWDKEGGLFTLIPWALQSSLHGYFWNLPDMIGGNGLNHNTTNIKGEPPEAELYIRWTQVNAFLMAMQFSYPPWHKSYGSELKVEEHVKDVLKIRTKYMPYLLDCVKKAVVDQEPVIRPMWWESDETAALGCRDQYMVGRDLVVAPVVTRGQVERDVFLPPGTWRDGNNASAPAITGPTTVHKYKAPLDILPFFYRENGAMDNAGTMPKAATPMMLLGAALLALAALLIN